MEIRHRDRPVDAADGTPPRPLVDPVDRAHLTGRSAPSPRISRYAPAADLTGLVRRYWVPAWDLAVPQVQKVLQYPVCLLVTASEYARFYGVATGLSTVELAGRGWAVGTMLTPAAGFLLWGGSVASMTDRFVDLGEVPGLDAVTLTRQVRQRMQDDPTDPAAHDRAIEVIEDGLRAFLPVDDEGLLVNALVAHVEATPHLTRVDALADHVGMNSRTLGRLTARRLGLSPKWLIQRRRLHEATARLKGGEVDLATLATELGYVDQAHFTHDYRRVTGLTPGAYRADQDTP